MRKDWSHVDIINLVTSVTETFIKTVNNNNCKLILIEVQIITVIVEEVVVKSSEQVACIQFLFSKWILLGRVVESPHEVIIILMRFNVGLHM